MPFSQPGYLSDPDRGLGRMIDEIAALQEMGVDRVALTPPGESLSAVLEHAHRLADALDRT